MGADSQTKKGFRRRTWGLRIAIYVVLLVGLTGAIGYLLTQGDSESDLDSASRFTAMHKFETADFHSLAVGADGRVLFGHHNGIQVSTDAGESWADLLAEPNRDAMVLAFDPFDPERVYMAGHEVYLVSDDAGSSWMEIETNLPSLDLHAFAASPVREGRTLAYSMGEGLFVSEDGGTTWAFLSEVPMGTAAVAELSNGTLLLAATDQGILRSDDGGETWTPSRDGIEMGAIFTLRAQPTGERVYAGTDHGVFVSADEGLTWSPTALDDIWAIGIGIDPSDARILYVINSHGFLYRSTDGGQVW